MASSAERKNKGKAPAQGYSQDKRLPAGQPFKMLEGAFGVKPRGSTSLQGDVPAEVTYSSGDMVIALQEVLSRNIQFHNGIYSELPDSIKFILDNLQFALLEITIMFSKKPLEPLKSILLTLLLKMRLILATVITLLQKTILFQKITLLQKMGLFEAALMPTLVNSLAKRKFIQWIIRL